MKKLISLILALAMVLSCAAALADTEIVVFADASMTVAMNSVKLLYEAHSEGVTITCSFDSSEAHKTQLEEGARCDLFISSAQ